MTYSERLGTAISYLEAVAIGLRQCQANELGMRLEEISRNIQSLALSARSAEQEKPRDALAPDYSDHLPVLMSYTGQMLDLDED